MTDCKPLPGQTVPESSPDFVANLEKLFPECNLVAAPGPQNYCTLFIQPKQDVDLTLEFRIQKKGFEDMSFVALLSKSLTKKELQPLERSLKLQTTISTKGQVLQEMLDIVNDFINVELEEFNETIKTVSHKKKKKKNQTMKNDTFVESAQKEMDTSNKNPISKSKGRKGKKFRRNLNFSGGSSESDEGELKTLISMFRNEYEVNTHEAACSSLLMSARPTHFVAVRITSPLIVEGLVASQKELVMSEPLLEKGVFAPEIFHLTLLTLGLDSPEDIENCVKALKKMRDSLIKSCPQKAFIIHSMSQFYNRAIFAKVKVEQDFLDFREKLKTGLESFNVEIRDMYEKFNPHLTIIKVKRPERKLFGHRNIQPAIYSHLKDTVFGEQKVEEIHLCSMDGQRREDGFYTSVLEIKFES